MVNLELTNMISNITTLYPRMCFSCDNEINKITKISIYRYLLNIKTLKKCAIQKLFENKKLTNIRVWESILHKVNLNETFLLSIDSTFHGYDKQIFWIYVSNSQKLSTEFILKNSNKLKKTEHLKNCIKYNRSINMIANEYNIEDMQELIYSFLL